MLGLALWESGVRPGACIVCTLARRGAIDGVEAGAGNPYCCICARPGVGIGGTSEDAEGPGSAIYALPLEPKNGDCCASIVAVAGPKPLPALRARDGDLGVRIRRGRG
jgi:hypothetical protein